ncbi:Spx/MgsR family RNA polymerase-binding regulatory protein [bacterium]|nr:Spx/MgsR family RNA polymerase-binding regulatory protein [bacterium]
MSRLKVYAYKNCSSCQKALGYLDARGVAYSLASIVEQPPDLGELQQMLVHLGGDVRRLFNTSGTVYRDLKVADQLKAGLSAEAALDLLARHGMLIKRPFLLGDKVGCVGFSASAWDQLML